MSIDCKPQSPSPRCRALRCFIRNRSVAAAVQRAALAVAAVTPCHVAAAGADKHGGAATAESVQAHLSVSTTGHAIVAWTSDLPPNDLAAGGPSLRHAPLGLDIHNGTRSYASKVLEWRGRLWNAAELDNLSEGSTYMYQCSLGGGSQWGQSLQLRAPRSSALAPGSEEITNPESPWRFAFLGDLLDSTSGSALVDNLTSGPQLDAVMHLGDIAGNLTDGGGLKADRFMKMIEPIASMVPYMTLPGDRDDLSFYDRYFQMPSEGSDPWYSYAVGPMRMIMLWTEALVDGVGLAEVTHAEQAQRQRTWLEASLAQFAAPEERRRRPWLFVAGHRPLYCSMSHIACGVEGVRLRAVLEPLFVEHGVDAYFSAHLHAYERSYPVSTGALCPSETRNPRLLENPCAPIYVVNGDAGQPPLRYHTPPATWTAQRRPGSPSHGELTLHNTTHLQYRQLATSGIVRDEFWLVKQDDSLAQDVVVMEEPFLDAVFWLACATLAITVSCGFIRWVHGDGVKRRDEALRNLRVELSVLAEAVPKVLGSAHEAEGLVGRPERANGVDNGRASSSSATAEYSV